VTKHKILATSLSRATSRENGRPPMVRPVNWEGAHSWAPRWMQRRPRAERKLFRP